MQYFTLDHKYELKKNIENLDKNELLEIFKIIKSDTKKYTENNNGIFINLKYLKKATLKKICNFVNYCKNNLLSTQEKKAFIPLNKDIVEDYDIDKMNEEFTAYQYQLGDIDIDKVDKTIVYPKLNNKKPKLTGVAARILRQCKEINKVNNDYILIGKKQKLKSKSKIVKPIPKISEENQEELENINTLDIRMDIDEMYSIMSGSDNEADMDDEQLMTIGY